MKKGLFIVLLILCMSFSQFPASAYLDHDLYTQETDNNFEYSLRDAYALHNIGLLQGTGNGFDLKRALTRAEAAALIVRLYGAQEEALEEHYPHPFTDVPEWADPYVGWMFEKGITRGVSNTLFDSDDKISAEGFLMLVMRALGYRDDSNGLYKLSDKKSYSLRDAALELGLFHEGEWIFYVQGGYDEDSPSKTEPFLRENTIEICLRALSCPVSEDECLLSSVLMNINPRMEAFTAFDLTVLDEQNILLTTASF